MFLLIVLENFNVVCVCDFNTSHVSINQYMAEVTKARAEDFNTSHVSINRIVRGHPVTTH